MLSVTPEIMGELVNGDRNSLWSGWALAPDSAAPYSSSIVSNWAEFFQDWSGKCCWGSISCPGQG